MAITILFLYLCVEIVDSNHVTEVLRRCGFSPTKLLTPWPGEGEMSRHAQAQGHKTARVSFDLSASSSDVLRDVYLCHFIGC